MTKMYIPLSMDDGLFEWDNEKELYYDAVNDTFRS